MEQLLIDSNALVDYLAGTTPASGMEFMDNAINATPKISVITKIEVLGYNTFSDSQKLLQDFIDSSLILDLSDEVVTQTISLRKKHKIKIPDAIIAATAICFHLTLITATKTVLKIFRILK